MIQITAASANQTKNDFKQVSPFYSGDNRSDSIKKSYVYRFEIDFDKRSVGTDSGFAN